MPDFVDFMLRTGSPRLTKVKELKTRPSYHPGTDYWKALRDKIIAAHQTGYDKDTVNSILVNLDSKKVRRYSAAVKGYHRFIGKKKPPWFSPPRATWTIEDLEVNINPELGLEIGGQRMAIKLHFKENQLKKQNADIILLMMNQALGANLAHGDTVAILDVERAKLFSSTGANASLMPLLHGEAVAFSTIWAQI